MKNTFLKYLLLLFAFVPQVLLADDGGYYIRNYHVDLTVHENNVYDVTETVDLTFTEQRHGFYRYVPYTFKWNVDDESQTKGYRTLDYVCDINNVKVDGWDFDVEDQDDNTVIRIGSENSTVIGDQTYIIHYTFVYPEDRIDSYDFLYHTLLPAYCYVPINHFSFRMKFDKTLDPDFLDNLYVYYGKYGESEEAENVAIQFKDNVLMGYADDIEPLHTVSLFAILPEGYYVGAKSVSPVPCVILFGISLFLILMILIQELRMKHPHLTKSIEFYPPNDISSAEVGTIIDETVDTVDIVSLLPWWAGKGYIDIEEKPDDKGRVGKHAKLKLIKKCELPSDAPNYQKKFMDLLFEKNTEVMLDSIGEKPTSYNMVKVALEKMFSGKKSLTHMSGKIWMLLLLAATSTLMFCLSYPVAYFDGFALLMAFCVWLLPAFLGWMWKEYGRTMQFMDAKWMHVVSFVIRLVAMLIVGALFITYFTNDDNGSLLTESLVIVMFVGTFIVVELSSRYIINTQYRTDMMGKLLGLKEFIETAEKPQLESLQETDPEYYYKVLPFAMVFGLTDKWSDLFKNIDMERPDWYHSSVNCDTLLFNHNLSQSFMSSAMHDIQVISHDSSSSSSSSGGGFSGGGGGGGGCGSW